MELPKLPSFDFPVEFEAATFTVIVDKAGHDPQHYAYLVQGWRPMLEAVARENYQRHPVHNDERVWLECCVLELLEVFGDVEAWDQATSSDFKPFRCVWQTGSITGNGQPLRKITVVRLFENELERALLQVGFPGGLRPGDDEEPDDGLSPAARRYKPTFKYLKQPRLGPDGRTIFGGYKEAVVREFLEIVELFLKDHPEWTEGFVLSASQSNHRLFKRLRDGEGFLIESLDDVQEAIYAIADGRIRLEDIVQERKANRSKGADRQGVDEANLREEPSH